MEMKYNTGGPEEDPTKLCKVSISKKLSDICNSKESLHSHASRMETQIYHSHKRRGSLLFQCHKKMPLIFFLLLDEFTSFHY